MFIHVFVHANAPVMHSGDRYCVENKLLRLSREKSKSVGSMAIRIAVSGVGCRDLSNEGFEFVYYWCYRVR